MKFSLFNNFGALNSAPVFAAIEKGLISLGHTVVKNDYTADAAVIWSMLWTGRMQGNRKVWQQYLNKPIIVAEVGMLQRGVTWKIGLNGTDINSYNFSNTIPNRDADLGLSLAPWRESGDHILVALQRQDSEQWVGQPNIKDWVDSVCTQLKKYTNRKIVVRSHPRQRIIPSAFTPNKLPGTYDSFDFNRALTNAWAVVNWNSGPGPQAIINGIPAFVGPSSLAAPMGNINLANIENPAMPDRSIWLNNLAHTEWTLNEISTGYPIQRLLPGLVSS